MLQYNLSIMCIDGDTIYGIISSDKQKIRLYLQEYDHEGSTIHLTRKEGEEFTQISDYEQIYKELGE